MLLMEGFNCFMLIVVVVFEGVRNVKEINFNGDLFV